MSAQLMAVGSIVAAVLGALAAFVTAISSFWWGKSLIEAKDAQLKARDEQLKIRDEHLQLLQELLPSRMIDHVEAIKQWYEGQLSFVREQAQLENNERSKRIAELQQRLSDLTDAESGLRVVSGASLVSEWAQMRAGEQYVPGQVRVASDGAIEYVTDVGVVLRLGFGPIGTLRERMLNAVDVSSRVPTDP